MKNKPRSLISAQFLLVLFIIVPFIVVLSLFSRSSQAKGTANEDGLVITKSVVPPNENFTASIVTTVVEVNVNAKTLKLKNNFTPPLAYQDLTHFPPFVVGIGDSTTNINSLFFPAFYTTTNIQKGSINLYPFDTYEAEFGVYFVGPNATQANSSLTQYVYFLEQYGWSFSAIDIPLGISNPDPAFVAGVRITFSRTVIFKLYPVFQIISFWLITVALFYYGSCILIWETKNIDPPLVGMLMSLLFALPVFRNTAPQSPPIGCLMDFASFYWAMLSVIIFAVGVLVKYTLLGKPAPAAPKPPPPSSPPKGEVEMVALFK